MTNTPQIIRRDRKCSKEFTPQYRNGVLVSHYCPDTRYEQALAKRREQMNVSRKNSLKSPEIANSGVVRKSRTTDLSKKSIDDLLEILKTHFNLFIRNRDRLPGNRFYCPTCDTEKPIEGQNYQACHVFPAGPYPALRFLEVNVHGGCLSCNYFKHGAGHEYNDWLRKKIGEVEYQKLLDLKDYWKAHQWHWDRFGLIRLIETYKAKNKLYQKN